MEQIEIDAELSTFLKRFAPLPPLQVLRLVLGFDRGRSYEHTAEGFREPVPEELIAAGGRLELPELYRRIEARGMLLAGDHRGAETHWQNRIRYLADKLRREGVLRPTAERGVWELSQAPMRNDSTGRENSPSGR